LANSILKYYLQKRRRENKLLNETTKAAELAERTPTATVYRANFLVAAAFIKGGALVWLAALFVVLAAVITIYILRSRDTL
jgi:hypothetical protein